MSVIKWSCHFAMSLSWQRGTEESTFENAAQADRQMSGTSEASLTNCSPFNMPGESVEAGNEATRSWQQIAENQWLALRFTLLVFLFAVGVSGPALGSAPNPCHAGTPQWTLTNYQSTGYGPFSCSMGPVIDPTNCYGEYNGFVIPGVFTYGMNGQATSGVWTITQHYAPNNVDLPVLGGDIACAPSKFFISVALQPQAQCGSSCNGAPSIPFVGDPINAATGSVFNSQNDVASFSEDALTFWRFYNSAAIENSDVGQKWRHSYSRSVTQKYSTIETQTYLQSANVSSQYADPATACTSGFTEIQSRVPNWTAATALYSENNCQITKNGVSIGSITVYSSGTFAPASAPVAYDAIRDDGQLIRFTVLNDAITAPPTINLKLQQTSSGYTLTDTNDTVEQYDTSGKLLSITTRTGVVQTMSYDSTGRLSTVTDSFGHQLILSYDSSNRVTTVTRQ